MIDFPPTDERLSAVIHMLCILKACQSVYDYACMTLRPTPNTDRLGSLKSVVITSQAATRWALGVYAGVVIIAPAPTGVSAIAFWELLFGTPLSIIHLGAVTIAFQVFTAKFEQKVGVENSFLLRLAPTMVTGTLLGIVLGSFTWSVEFAERVQSLRAGLALCLICFAVSPLSLAWRLRKWFRAQLLGKRQRLSRSAARQERTGPIVDVAPIKHRHDPSTQDSTRE